MCVFALLYGLEFLHKILLDQIQCAADKVAIAIRKISVIASDHRIEAKAPILPKRNLAQKKIPQHIRSK